MNASRDSRYAIGMVGILFSATLILGGETPVVAQQRPSQNPCDAKNPCAAKATEVDPKLITRPAGTKLAAGQQAELIKLGEQLWKDTKLSTNELSCETCHRANASFSPSFAKPYPHPVVMVTEKAGLKQIHMDEMVQICLVVPMASKPLPWNSKELAALTAYVGKVQKGFAAEQTKKPAASNPCAPRNPCAPKNPCSPNK